MFIGPASASAIVSVSSSGSGAVAVNKNHENSSTGGGKTRAEQDASNDVGGSILLGSLILIMLGYFLYVAIRKPRDPWQGEDPRPKS